MVQKKKLMSTQVSVQSILINDISKQQVNTMTNTGSQTTASGSTPVSGVAKQRGRGRPRKYPIGESPAEKLQAARESGLTRGRGRPRKYPIQTKISNSNNAGTATGNYSSNSSRIASVEFDTMSIRSVISSSDEAANTKSKDIRIKDINKRHHANDSTTNDSPAVKRGRGRPPKPKSIETLESFRSNTAKAPSGKPRGRPPKQSTVPQTRIDFEKLKAPTRGRPRKLPQNEELPQ